MKDLIQKQVTCKTLEIGWTIRGIIMTNLIPLLVILVIMQIIKRRSLNLEDEIGFQNIYCSFLLKEFSFLFIDSPLPCSSNLQRLKRKHDSSSSCVLEVVQNTGASVKKQGKQHKKLICEIYAPSAENTVKN